MFMPKHIMWLEYVDKVFPHLTNTPCQTVQMGCFCCSYCCWFCMALIITGTFWFTGTSCTSVWTGGFTSHPANGMTDHWRWLYTTDLEGPSEAFSYTKWHSKEPNNDGGTQNIVRLLKNHNFDFSDANSEYLSSVFCYVCEGPRNI